MSLETLHWFWWIVLFVGVASGLYDLATAARFVRANDVDVPLFTLPVACLTVVLYKLVNP